MCFGRHWSIRLTFVNGKLLISLIGLLSRTNGTDWWPFGAEKPGVLEESIFLVAIVKKEIGDPHWERIDIVGEYNKLDKLYICVRLSIQ